MTDPVGRLEALAAPALLVDSAGTVLAANRAFRSQVDAPLEVGETRLADVEREGDGDIAAWVADHRPVPTAVEETPGVDRLLVGTASGDVAVDSVADGDRFLWLFDGQSAGPVVDGPFVSRLPFPTLQVRADGSVVAVNPALEELLGWSELDLLGEPPAFLGDDAQPAWQELVSRSVSGGAPDARVLSLRTVSGRTLEARAHAFAYRDAASATSAVVVLEEVTDELARARELELLRRVLRHDLRNEVTIVRGHAELLADHVDDPAVREAVREVVDAADRIGRASEKTRDLRRVSEASRERRTVDVATVARAVVGRVESAHEDAEIDCSTPEQALATAVPVIDLALKNLVTNAIVHNDGPTPHVEVAVRTIKDLGEGAVEIRVRDDGPRIPEMELRTLERGQEDALNHTSGLGLWIARRIVAQSDGELLYEENEPRGNVVTVRLPHSAPGADGQFPDLGRR